MVYYPFSSSLPASPCTHNEVTLPTGTNVLYRYTPIKFNDGPPKRLGGKDLTMKQINKLRYG